jgi:hypothetical protein
LESVVSDGGRQIDRSDEHPENADSPSIETLEPASNVKCERSVQFLKQPHEIVSIDAGIQIHLSDEQSENARSRRFEILQSGSNVTDISEPYPAKHPAPMVSASGKTVTWLSFPKYRTRQLCSKSIRNSPEISKKSWSLSTEMRRILEFANDKPVT